MVDTDRIAGTARELGGKAQAAIGDVVGSQRDSVEGRFRDAHGRAQDTLGQAKDAAQDALGDAQGKAREVYGQAKDRFGDVADDVSGYAEDAYERGGAYLRDGRRAVSSQVEENPLVALLIAGAVGYGLALLLHGRR